MTDPDRLLIAVLERARGNGFLGAGPVEEHREHARVLTRTIPSEAASFVDLGSGGGLPGLVIARERPDLRGVLVEGSTARGALLEDAVAELGLDGRVEVWIERAEVVGRRGACRGAFDVAVARSFGVPAVVAECAAPLLRVGGQLIVSDPPSDVCRVTRWPADGLEQLGLRVVAQYQEWPAHTVLEQQAPCPMRYPRRVGIPAKRPLF